MKREEKQYFQILEKLVRDEKKNSIFFKEGSDNFALDIELLFRHLQKKDPNFLNHMFDQYIDTTQLKGFKSVAEVKELVASLKKGSIVKWQDKDGRELFYVNQGRNILTGKKQIYICSNLLSKKDIKSLQKSFMEHILKKDLKQVYKKIQKENLQKKNKKKNLLKETVLQRNEYKQKQLSVTGSSFEKQFKKAIMEIGSSSVDSVMVAKTIFSTKSNGEKRDISAAFSHLTEDGFKSLLSSWKDETLDKSVSRNKNNTIENGIGR